MKILVTGGAGFIGSQLCEKLILEKNNTVYCIDNFDNFYDIEIKKSNILGLLKNDNFIFHEIDITSMEHLKRTLTDDFDVIIHLAAKAGVRPSIEKPLLFNNVNVRGTQNLLEFAKKKNIYKFIFASSSSVYGINKNVPWKENDNVLLPISPYASTKISGELLGHVYSSLYGIKFYALRFFTVYGPRQRPDLAIYKFFEAIYNDIPIVIYGDGQTSRDYTYVDDIVQGIISTLSYDKSKYEIFNLGNSKTIKLDDLIELIEQTIGKSASKKYIECQLGDVPRTYANIVKANLELNYKPIVQIEEGLKIFNDWFKEILLTKRY